MAHLHQDLAQGKWQMLSLPEQLGNIGSDFERALRWKTKNQPELFRSAVGRTLELLDFTVSNPALTSHRRREIARLREEVCKVFLDESSTTLSAQGLQRYFLSMATLARNNTQVDQ